MREREKKFVFVTGGVLSSLGKGLAAASMGALLEARGLRVSFLKLDPYLNVDPGTMNPFQHGEVYVTEDGAETDLDLGHYERFTSAVMGRKNNVTAGSIYEAVLEKERRGEYLGRTVQVIPHVTDEIVARIWRAAADVDLLFAEVGGTVGDIESLPFLEAIRQFRLQAGRGNVCYVHMGLVPYVATAGELKTKPVQHSVKELRAVGISPDVILCRTDRPLPRAVKDKIALFCNVDEDAVITAADVDSIYEVPLLFHEEGVDETLTRLLNIWTGRPDLERWHRLSSGARCARREVEIAMVGKYVDLTESYKSLNEALYHAGLSHGARVHIHYVDAEKLAGPEGLPDVAGVLVPHGFGGRGAEGKIVAIRYAGKSGSPSSASVSVCSWRLSNRVATSPESPMPAPPSSTRRPRAPSSICFPLSATSRSWAPPCASAPIPVSSYRVAAPTLPTAPSASQNATATATKSIPPSVAPSPGPG